MNKLWFWVTYIAFVAVFTFVLYLGIPEHPIADFFYSGNYICRIHIVSLGFQ